MIVAGAQQYKDSLFQAVGVFGVIVTVVVGASGRWSARRIERRIITHHVRTWDSEPDSHDRTMHTVTVGPGTITAASELIERRIPASTLRAIRVLKGDVFFDNGPWLVFCPSRCWTDAASAMQWLEEARAMLGRPDLSIERADELAA